MKLPFNLNIPIVSLIAVLFIATTTTSQAQTVEFRGGGFLSDFNDDCAPFFGPGNRVYVETRYRPRNLGANGDESLIAFSNSFFWQASFSLDGAEFSEEWQRAEGFHGGIATFRTRPAPVLRFRQQEPAVLTNASEDVYIVGQVRNFMLPGCRATYRLALIRRP